MKNGFSLMLGVRRSAGVARSTGARGSVDTMPSCRRVNSTGLASLSESSQRVAVCIATESMAIGAGGAAVAGAVVTGAPGADAIGAAGRTACALGTRLPTTDAASPTTTSTAASDPTRIHFRRLG